MEVKVNFFPQATGGPNKKKNLFAVGENSRFDNMETSHYNVENPFRLGPKGSQMETKEEFEKSKNLWSVS